MTNAEVQAELAKHPPDAECVMSMGFGYGYSESLVSGEVELTRAIKSVYEDEGKIVIDDTPPPVMARHTNP